MKVLQTIGGFNANFGGTSTCTYDLMTAIDDLKTCHQVDLLAPDTGKMIVNDVGWLKAVPCDYKTSLCLSRNMTNFLSNSNYDLYHTNGLWMHVNHTTCSIARKKSRPYIITPHGTLYPQALKRGFWKKWPFLKIWFNKDIYKANCLHATCFEEMNYIRDFGYDGPIAYIPNPVDIPDYTEDIFNKRTYHNNNDRLRIGYLGRIHPRKRVENIIYALAENNALDVELIIIGKGDDEYENFLKAETKRLGLESNVKFMGFVTGREKFEALSLLSALIVPSDFENFGMIIPEALIVGTPVFASTGTPWKSLISEDCGWWRDNSVESISEFIPTLVSINGDRLKEMGTNGREYIKRDFSSSCISRQMIDLYSWLLGKCPQPQFVYTR